MRHNRGVALFLTPEPLAGVRVQFASAISLSNGKAEKEVGKMITLTSGRKMTITAFPAPDAFARPFRGHAGS
jgi:hypothetical protein